MSDSDLEEDMCTCGRYYTYRHGWCSLCIDNWIDENFISGQIYDAGYKHGSDLGIECGIRHTINREARDDFWILDDIDIPQYAYSDRRGYENGFERGYTSAYNSVYELNQPVVNQLNDVYKKYCVRFWTFTFYRHHRLFDTALLKLIDDFLPPSKKTKIPHVNFTFSR